MTLTLSEQIANVTWPVYAMIGYLIYINYKATKPSIVPIRKSLIIPLFFVLAGGFLLNMTSMSIYNILMTSIVWLAASACGFVVGWTLYKKQDVKAIKGTRTLYRPGSWHSMGLLVIITILQCAHLYWNSHTPIATRQQAYTLSWVFLYTTIASIFIGRFAYSLRCIKQGPYYTA